AVPGAGDRRSARAGEHPHAHGRGAHEARARSGSVGSPGAGERAGAGVRRSRAAVGVGAPPGRGLHAARRSAGRAHRSAPRARIGGEGRLAHQRRHGPSRARHGAGQGRHHRRGQAAGRRPPAEVDRDPRRHRARARARPLVPELRRSAARARRRRRRGHVQRARHRDHRAARAQRGADLRRQRKQAAAAQPRIAMALPVPDDVVELCQKLRDAGFEAWLVGGAVRDLLRGRPAKDFDVATSAQPAEVTRVFGRKRTIPTGEKHGTVTVLTERAGQKEHVEVTTYRGEGAYSDGRRPDDVVFVRTLEEDLKRRDFTMNAIAYDPLAAELADPYGGQRDLEARLIRAVGDPLERFAEDGLRAMRAVRFAAQHEFAIDPATERAIPETIDVFKKVSAERVRDELVKILSSRVPSVGLELMRTTGLLAATIPELLEGVGMHQNKHHKHDVWHHTLAAVDATELSGDPPWLVRFAALLHDVAKPRTAAPKEDSPTENTFYRHEHVGAAMADD